MRLPIGAPALAQHAARPSVLHAKDSGSLGALVAVITSAATAGIVLTRHDIVAAASERPLELLLFLALTIVLHSLAAELYGHGSISVAGVGMLATGFTFGAGPAMAVAAVTNGLHGLRKRGRPHRVLFSTSTLALATGLAAATFGALELEPLAAKLAPALAAAGVFWIVNVGLLSYAMGLSDPEGPLAVWRERFRWSTAQYFAFGPLALAASVGYEHLGVVGLLAFILPPALMVFSVRQYVARTKQGVEEVRRANDDLRTANAELAARNDDLQALLRFTGGLASRAHDRGELVAYTEDAIGRLTGGKAVIRPADDEGGIELVAGKTVVGRLAFDEAPQLDAARWLRLREAIVPQVATAIESAELVEQVRKTHLATIAALSKSMEAKDYYTGGHTERVASVAVALARRLGYSGADLDAIEVGALLHDIGKIGIPERILQKPGPLDDDEWKVMREHPVISEYILSEVELHPIVLQIARSSHERIDGKGYPDARSGDEIPLPARIVLVADAFDALTSDRPYRSGRSVPAAIEELRAHAGTQFCPVVIEAMDRLYADEPDMLGVPRLQAVSAA